MVCLNSLVYFGLFFVDIFTPPFCVFYYSILVHFFGSGPDAAYESLVLQIAGDKLQTDSRESLKESVERDEKKKQIEKQIAALESKMRKEKQLNRRMEMNADLKRLRKGLQDLL